jgi:APA family basic amino acid/polyamine antiporter
MMAGSAIVFFAYIGFDSVSCQSEEAKRPERDVPLAMCASLGISTVLYVGVSIVLTGMVKYSEIDMNAPLSTVFTQKGHHWAGYFVAIGAVAGMTSVLLVSMLSQPRIFLAMSRHGLLPPCMGWVHPHFKTPWVSTLVTGAVVAVISCVIPISILVSFVSIGTLVAFLFVCVAVVVLRHTQPDLYRPFRCPWVPFVPITGGLLCLLLMFSLPVNTWYRLLVWM